MHRSFAGAARGRVELSKLSKATLVVLSHVLEDLILDDDVPATVLTGFQSSRNWNSELLRYERLATNRARSVAVFTGDELHETGQVVGFRLADGDPLRQEWFIIALTDRFSCALFGVDNLECESPIVEVDRVFDATWTFDPELIDELCQIVISAAHQTSPDRSEFVVDAINRFPPVDTAPEIERRFTRSVFEVLEASRQRWRQQLVKEQDLRERLQATEFAQQRLERLAGIGTTAAALAHEINNPLAAIGMWANVMVEDAQGLVSRLDLGGVDGIRKSLSEIAEQGALIESTVARTGRMARGMLDLVRVVEIPVVLFEFRHWLALTTEEICASMTCAIEITGPADVQVQAEPDRVRHILNNLVRNAVDAAGTTEPIRITVERNVSSLVEIRVIDSGPGILEEIRSNLFTPFATSKASQGGNGLGLAISRRFAEDIGGSLQLESTGPQGTTMLLCLDSGDGRSQPASTPASARLAEAPVTTRSRALVIDDDTTVRSSLAGMLRREGWEVDTADGPDAAVVAVATHRHRVIFMDFRLSDSISFGDLLERLEARQPGTRSRTVMITGSLDDEVRHHADLPILRKPFSRNDLTSTLGSVASG